MDYQFLSNTLLFRGISPDEIRAMTACLCPAVRLYPKGSAIYRAGDTVTALGLVLSGSVSIESNDAWGNTAVLDRVFPGQVFAETYACLPGEPLMVSVTAAEPSEILFLDTGRMLHTCQQSCGFHHTLIRNLLTISSRKNLNLSRRIFHTSSKSVRGRLLSYLSFQAIHHGSREFDIPFNRQQLADYLGVDRSAMSAELGKMRQEGLLETQRSHFRLLNLQP